jgi:hypothetical protein
MIKHQSRFYMFEDHSIKWVLWINLTIWGVVRLDGDWDFFLCVGSTRLPKCLYIGQNLNAK